MYRRETEPTPLAFMPPWAMVAISVCIYVAFIIGFVVVAIALTGDWGSWTRRCRRQRQRPIEPKPTILEEGMFLVSPFLKGGPLHEDRSISQHDVPSVTSVQLPPPAYFPPVDTHLDPAA